MENKAACKKKLYITLTKQQIDRLNIIAKNEELSRSNIIGRLINKEYIIKYYKR